MSELEMNKLQDKIEELEQQNAELMAHIEDSKHVMMVVANCDTKETANVITDKWIEQTPQQSLAKIKADSIEALIKETECDIKLPYDGGTYTIKGLIQVEDAIHYTNQLRKQS